MLLQISYPYSFCSIMFVVNTPADLHPSISVYWNNNCSGVKKISAYMSIFLNFIVHVYAIQSYLTIVLLNRA
jgi:hypothetical protein